MSLYTDSHYLSLLSTRLRNFKHKQQYVWNFSCPLCGDSKKDKKKARGYVFRKGNDLFFKCHNCQQGRNIATLLKEVDHELHDQYIMERFRKGNTKNIKNSEIDRLTSAPQPKFKKVHEVLKGMKRVSSLEEGHVCLEYIKSRKIPERKYRDLYWCDDFKQLAIRLGGDKYKTLPDNDARLVIPFINEQDELMGIQGRTLDPENNLRYITLKVDDNTPKIFGLDTVDKAKTVYVFEGPIDSLFIPNSVAMACSALHTVEQFIPKEKCVLVPDREPRNKQLVMQIDKWIDEGWTVSLLPDTVQSKDINDMILKDRLTPEYILEMIQQNMCVGLSGQLKFSNWKGCKL